MKIANLNPLRGCLGAALLAAGLAPLQARVVAVYTVAPDEPAVFAELKAAALAVRDGGESGNPAFTVRTGESARLTEAFSVSPGYVAYFWSDETFEWGDGFRAEGISTTFDAEIPRAEALAKPVAEGPPVKAHATAFGDVAWTSGNLRLRYSLAKANRVSLEAYEMGGRTLGKWNWRDPSAGAYEKNLDLPDIGSGTVFVRWKSGNLQTVHKLTPRGVKGK